MSGQCGSGGCGSGAGSIDQQQLGGQSGARSDLGKEDQVLTRTPAILEVGDRQGREKRFSVFVHVLPQRHGGHPVAVRQALEGQASSESDRSRRKELIDETGPMLIWLEYERVDRPRHAPLAIPQDQPEMDHLVERVGKSDARSQ